MQNIITLEVLSATSEKSFSLDELVFRTKNWDVNKIFKKMKIGVLN